MNRSSHSLFSPPARTRLLQSVSGESVRDPLASSWATAQPIFQTAAFGYDSTERAAASCAAPHPSDCYSRYGNPNFSAVERALTELEGAEAALVTGSGMGAISLVLLGSLASGDHVVAQRTHYAATTSAFGHWLPRLGVEITQVDQTDVEAFAEAIRDDTRLIFLETPANPLLTLTDLAAVARLARRHGITTCVDSTLATPLNQRPIDLGIDLVVHSATKYLAGHGDVTAGVIAGDGRRIDTLWEALIVYGMVLHPFDAWLLGRGLQSLPFRVPVHNDNALELAAYLDEHPRVEHVYYPGLPSHPQHDLARRQMTGWGGLLSFRVEGGYEAAEAIVGRLQLPELAVSLGSTRSHAVHVASMIYPHVDPDSRRAAGVEDDLIRVAVGLEAIDDLRSDFAQALGAGTR